MVSKASPKSQASQTPKNSKVSQSFQSFQSLQAQYNTEEQSGLDPQIAEAIRQTLDIALSAGADAADIVLSEGQSQSLKSQSGKISENKLAASRLMGVRVQKNQQMGLAYSESLSEADRYKMVKMALHNAEFTKQDSSQGIHTSATNPLLPDCSMQCSSEEIPLAQKEELALKLESEPLARDARVRVVPYNGFVEGYSGHYVANSKGVFCYERSHSYSCYSYVLMEEGGNKAEYGESSISRTFAQLDWEFCVAKSVEEATLLLNAAPLPKSGKNAYDVIFTPDSLACLLGCFEIMFSGFAAKTKTNPMREKLGQAIASEQLQIYDLPRYAESLHMQFFDSEGSVPEDLALIENGVLKNFYHNSETAHYFGIEPNARGARSPQGSLGTAGNVLLIAPHCNATSGSNIRDGEFFEVLELNGLHSGCDAISGDFSLPCTGKLYRDGQLIQGVRDVTLAGNFYEMLNQIDAIGTEIKSSTGKSFFTPDLRFSGLTIAG